MPLKPVDIGDLLLAQPAEMSASMAHGAPAASGGGQGGTSASMSQAAGMTMAPAKGKDGAQQRPVGCFGGGMAGMLLPLVLMFVIFYFFLIRPQQKKQKEHQNMLNALRKGDRIITTGGILGTITGLTDQYAVIEIQEKVRMKILRSHIAGKQASAESTKSKS